MWTSPQYASGSSAGACRLISVTAESGDEQVGLAAVLQRTHRLGEHVVVELEADLHHVAALVLAEHLAGAADLEVVHREVEARAELFHLLDRLEPLRRLPSTRPSTSGTMQVRVGLVVRAADAAAQLVQLREAELVGAADDDRVRARHVDAGLDDRRAQQDVVALGDEVAHHALELALGHLAVRDGDARLGHAAPAGSRAGARSSARRCAGSRPGRRA